MKSKQALLDRILRETFSYFEQEMNVKTGLLPDKTAPHSPASIAAVGMAFGTYVIAIEKKLMSRAEAARRIFLALKFFDSSKQSKSPRATGYKGFYYHFLDMKTGQRALQSELSTIDTAILIAGALTAAQYFNTNDAVEVQIRYLAKKLYERVDWKWALNKNATLSHGWKPEEGFLPTSWNQGYSEAHILYILALGSPTHPIPAKGYTSWTSTFEWQTHYGYDYIYAGPLFIHQLSQVWLDLKGIKDDFVAKKRIDYFENSRRATHVQQLYAIENPHHFHRYGKNVWGLSACAGPGPKEGVVRGVHRKFLGYEARGVPYGPDDGTVCPWAVIASLPFEPRLVLETTQHFAYRLSLLPHGAYGFEASFNASFPRHKKGFHSWVSPFRTGINQGPVILMIGNYESEAIWKITRQIPAIIKGLERAGFKGGWLKKKKSIRRKTR
jgi:hypothetical protein